MDVGIARIKLERVVKELEILSGTSASDAKKKAAALHKSTATTKPKKTPAANHPEPENDAFFQLMMAGRKAKAKNTYKPKKTAPDLSEEEEDDDLDDDTTDTAPGANGSAKLSLLGKGAGSGKPGGFAGRVERAMPRPGSRSAGLADDPRASWGVRCGGITSDPLPLLQELILARMKHPRGSDSKKAVEPSNTRTALLTTILMSRTVLPAPAARPRSSDNSNSSRSDTIFSPSSGLMKHSEKGHRKRSQEFIIPSTSSESRSVGESGIPSTYIPTNSINASTQKKMAVLINPRGICIPTMPII
ncbi:hypothetical protein B0H10DRAFT_2200631 [Mycena sp. CBHHK59/15]|nr:hypothetical protein B0H10DRAFT_2200631 [Mycena sp. CBHHK59/15]